MGAAARREVKASPADRGDHTFEHSAVDREPDAGIRVEVSGAVAWLTLDRPEQRNPQTPATWRALARIGSELDASVRVVVVRGSGTAFSAGLDRAVLAGLRQGTVTQFGADDLATYQAGFSWLRRPSIVSIAAVQGHAIGAGFQLALACDIRIGASDVQFSMAEVSLGLIPDLGGTLRLVDLIGYSRALDVCVTCRRIGADEALRLGLVSAIVETVELDTAIEKYVTTILAMPRDAVIEVKALLDGAAARTTADQLTAERDAQLRRLGDLLGRHSEA